MVSDVSDVLGKIVYQSIENSGRELLINTSQMSDGIYHYQIIENGKPWTQENLLFKNKFA